VDKDGIDTEAFAGGQGFAGDLEEDSFVHVRLSIAWWERPLSTGSYGWAFRGGVV
jgi:hypothetical protein